MFLGQRAGFTSIVSQLDPTGTLWQAHVVQAKGAARTVLLSGSGPTLHEAIEDLHRKSAQAVDRQATATGFRDVPAPPGTNRRRRWLYQGAWETARDGIFDSTTLSSSNASDHSASDSDFSTIGREPHRSTSLGRPLSWEKIKDKAPPHHIDSASDRRFVRPGPAKVVDETTSARLPTTPGTNRLLFPAGPVERGRTMPDADGNTANGAFKGHRRISSPVLRPNARNLERDATSSRTPPPPWSTSTAPPFGPVRPLAQRAVILTIKWQGHGEATFAEQCALSLAAIQAKAKHLVAKQQGEFGPVNADERSSLRMHEYDAVVRKVRVDGQAILVEGTEDCFSMMIQYAAGGTPRVIQVYVDVVRREAGRREAFGDD
ncbi:hypothetical protein HIM_03351 [Hirsutella minnesotensis 3608]|uniref:Uncharacterized protein n=1 Tax=Hirsutella minnesotensis 3608 TaxID=1043627 RepID=A0A0F7ZQC9_9HYPO|nr:hypothetical protein HIM_03351 [Hirsutella minnesotensis 3608]